MKCLHVLVCSGGMTWQCGRDMGHPDLHRSGWDGTEWKDGVDLRTDDGTHYVDTAPRQLRIL